MNRVPRLALFGILFGALVGSLAAQSTYYWTDVGIGWHGQVPPPSNGTADLIFLESFNHNISLATTNNVNSLTFTNDTDYIFSGGGNYNLTANSISLAPFTAGEINRVKFDTNVTLALAGATSWDAGYGTFIVSGAVTGTGPLTLTLTSDGNGTGSYIFNNGGAGNSYTGPTTITSVGTANGSGTIAFWNSSPFGTGAVTITNGVYFAAHNTVTLTNAFTVTAPSGNAWALRAWDAPLTLSGPITLAADDFISASYSFNAFPAPNIEGSFPLPGQIHRNPIVFSGNIGDGGGNHSLTISGGGIVVLTGTNNTYTGGTTINGSVVFGTNTSLPASGSIQVNGYAGSADVTTGHFATFLASLSPGSAGSVGVDTLPGNSTSILADNINLSGFSSSIRLGTATSATLTGTITPFGSNYHFGGGGGTLTVQSALTLSTYQVYMDNSMPGNVVPLKLYLQGANTYSGGTFVNDGFVIFDGASAIPASGSLTAAGTGNSYIGYTDNVTGMTPAVFLAKFSTPSTNGIIGFDTHAGNSTVNIGTPINLTGFNNGVFLGTATSATLSGTITPTADNTFRFTAGNGGTLTVNSSLSGTAVVIGTSALTAAYSDGTVVLNAANSYTGGTTLSPNGGITLSLGNAGALGSGALNIAPSTGYNYNVGLQTTSTLSIANNIVFQTPDYMTNSSAQLFLTGSNNFNLLGTITSGPASSTNSPGGITLYSATPISVSLNGNNSGYSGSIDVFNGTLNLGNNNAAGLGTLNIDSASATVAFTGTAINPVLYGLKGDAGSLVLPNTTSLTINTDTTYNNYEFGGVISGASGASLTVAASTTTNVLYLSGANTYSGGTTITGYAAVALGNNSAAGTGPVTLSAPNGGLVLNSNISFTNALVFNSGVLGGLGTFSPSGVSGTGQTAGSITFGANQKVLPGIPGDSSKTPGTLTLATNVAFKDNGTYDWVLQDATVADGYSHLQITGNLDLTSISTGFILKLETVDILGANGTPNWALAQAYSLPILQTTGTITGFSAGKFTIDPSAFAGGALLASDFTVSIDGTNKILYLNFTSVPEPSTYALMGLGLSVLVLPILRRRRA